MKRIILLLVSLLPVLSAFSQKEKDLTLLKEQIQSIIHSCKAQVGVAFALPAALAVVHDCFGLMLVRQLAGGVPDGVFLAIAACSVAGTLGLLALYYLLCVRECSRVLLGGTWDRPYKVS